MIEESWIMRCSDHDSFCDNNTGWYVDGVEALEARALAAGWIKNYGMHFCPEHAEKWRGVDMKKHLKAEKKKYRGKKGKKR